MSVSSDGSVASWDVVGARCSTGPAASDGLTDNSSGGHGHGQTHTHTHGNGYGYGYGSNSNSGHMNGSTSIDINRRRTVDEVLLPTGRLRSAEKNIIILQPCVPMTIDCADFCLTSQPP